MKTLRTVCAFAVVSFVAGATIHGKDDIHCDSITIGGGADGSIVVGKSSGGLLIQVYDGTSRSPRCSLGLFRDGGQDQGPGIHLYDRKGNESVSISLAPLAEGGEYAAIRIKDQSRLCVELGGAIRQDVDVPRMEHHLFIGSDGGIEASGQSANRGTVYGPEGVMPQSTDLSK